MKEQIGAIDVPKIPSQESERGSHNCPSERISERMKEQIGAIDVPKIPSQESDVKSQLSLRANF